MIKRIAGGVVGLVVILVVIALKFGAGFGIGFLGAKAGAPDIGDCVTVSGGLSDADVNDATCGADGVLYKVVGKGDCDELEDSVSYTVGGKEAVEICMWPSVADGTCVSVGTDGWTQIVDCSTADRQEAFQIVKTLDSADGPCPKQSQSVVNKTRDVAICVGPVKG